METLLQDIRYANRGLIKSPGFAAAAIITLALGIGANTAIFSVVNGVLLRPLPYTHPEQIAYIWTDNRAVGIHQATSAYPNFDDWRDLNQSFQQMAAYLPQGYFIGRGEPERVRGADVSAGFFSALGVGASLGRAFLPEEERGGAGPVIVISHGLWQRRFGADPGIVGEVVPINGVNCTLVGVMPPSFQIPEKAEIWRPLAVVPGMPQVLKNRYVGGRFIVFGRLKPHVTLGQARAEMQVIASRLEERYPKENAGQGINVVSLRDQIAGQIRPGLLLLQGVVCLLLLIACANVANLLLARAAARQKEIVIRSALGASRLRVLRQLLAESLLLAVAGGALGLLVAFWGVRLLLAISPADIPLVDQIGVDGKVLGFTLMISVATGLLFGLAPALQVSKPQLSEALKERNRSAGGSRRRRMRESLVAFEIAFALVLLIAGGLMVGSFLRLQRVAPGFNVERLLTASIVVPTFKYREQAKVKAIFQQILERVGSLPGVSSVGAHGTELFYGKEVSRSLLIIEGQPASPPAEITYDYISADYLGTMGIPLLRGRFFTERDGPDAPPVVIVNERFARIYWPGKDPTGRVLRFADEEGWRTVVGVVGDVRRAGLDAETKPEFFLPAIQAVVPRSVFLVVRTTAEPSSLAADVRQAISAIDQELPVLDLQTGEQLLAKQVSQRRLITTMFGFFAAIALTLAAVGVYGVMSYSVTQRTHEMGIRMALGAQRSDIFKLVVGHAMALTAIGMAIGLTVALALTRLMASLLYGVSATDPATFVGSSFFLTIVALAASYMPTRRASNVTPMTALRYE